VQKCLDNGTVPILTTIPPKGSQAKNAKERQLVESFVDAARSVAQEKHIPLIDLYKEMLDRQPADFATTLLGDNLHPSYPKEHRQNFRAESLRQSGYTLRNYLTLKACYDVHQQVLSQVKSKRAAASEAGWTGAVLRDQPAVLIPKVDAAPTVDGRMDDACWQKAQLLTFRRLDGDPAKPKSPTHAKLVATKDAVYIAFRCSHAGRLVARERDHDSSVWEDDSVEVFLKAGPEPTRDYHHLIVNALGSFHDARGKDSRAWDPAIQVATDRAAGHWSVEIGIPFAELGLPADKARLAGPWRLNLARMRPARNGEPAEESALSPTEDSSSHVPARFGYAFFEVFGGRLP